MNTETKNTLSDDDLNEFMDIIDRLADRCMKGPFTATEFMREECQKIISEEKIAGMV